jgi:hypothetical protein
MKKLFAALFCAVLLCSCTGGSEPASTVPEETQTPASAPSETRIAASEKAPDYSKWTTLGKADITIDGETAEVSLLTEAERGSDGYMLWDDSQKWALIAQTDDKEYTLYSANTAGRLYIDVMTDNDEPVISLIGVSTVGLSVTKYTYKDGAFYSDTVLGGGENNIYTSIPDYDE